MSKLLTLPESKLNEAVTVIGNEVKKFRPSVTDSYIKKLLSAYYNAGTQKTVSDYGAGWEKNNQVIAKVQKLIGENDYSLVKNVLDFMEIFAERGQVFPNLARPNFAQTQFEQMLKTGHKNDPTTGQVIAKGVHDFFGFAGSIVSDVTTPAISGLWSGLSTPMKVALVGGVIVAGYVFLKPYIK